MVFFCDLWSGSDWFLVALGDSSGFSCLWSFFWFLMGFGNFRLVFFGILVVCLVLGFGDLQSFFFAFSGCWLES